MLLAKIYTSPPDSSGGSSPDTSADYFESSLSTIFNDVRNQHGDAGHTVTYTSEKYGDIKMTLADVDKDDTGLFSHNLWNAGVEVAGMIESGEVLTEGKAVVELGSGAALPSIIAHKAGAKEVVSTDYPSEQILSNISSNLAKNDAKATIHGHKWGTFHEVLTPLKHHFDLVIAADTLWMEWEHENLVDSILFFLNENTEARVIVVAGLHTGRARQSGFWEVAEEKGLSIEKLVERDVDGVMRPYVKDRGVEDVVDRKRWLIIGILKRNMEPKKSSTPSYYSVP